MRRGAAPLGLLAFGHVISQWLRTLPAIAASDLAASLGFGERGLAVATGLMALAFTLGQVPVGVLLDRIGPRRTALVLLGLAAAGSAAAALAPTRALFALGLVIAGFGCAGLMMAPLAFAGRILPPERFGFVSGLLPGIGGIGLLLSGSPSAALVAAGGFRLAYAAAAAASLALALAVARAVPELPPASRHARVADEAAEVLRLFAGRRLRAPVVLAFVGYPALIGLRGLWAGPYLMHVLGLGIGAAGDVLGLISLLMIAGPVGFGWLDRRLPDRALAIGAIHLAAAAPLLLLALGGAGASADIAAMAVFSVALTVHVLLYPMARALVDEGVLGKALAAVNLAFFAGVSVLQPLSGVAAERAGIGGALGLYAAALAAGSAWFLALLERR